MSREYQPSSRVVEELLTDLLTGRRSREEVASWATTRLGTYDFESDRLREVMFFLADVDRPDQDSSLYRYGPEDFQDRLDDILDDDSADDDRA
ncbi:MAG: hypothetical protein NVSMB14_03290 [Isosphaeraceae bacterium]